MFRPSEHSKAPLNDFFRPRVLRPRRSEPKVKRSITSTVVAAVGLFAISLAMTGCPPHSVQPISVSVSSPSSTVLVGNTLQFSAIVTGTSNNAVTWSVPAGTISPTGLYTAPADLPKGAVIVTATSQAQSTANGQETISVTSDVAVSLATSPPNTSSILTSASLRLNEVISSAGHPDSAVIWTVNGSANGNASVGTISSAQQSTVYTAPSAVPSPMTVAIQATSVADPTKFASIALTVIPNVQISVFPTSTNVLLGNWQQFTAAITGSTNTAVTWSVNPAIGSISSSGLYTAPGDLPNPATVTITAISQADSTKIASASVSVTSDVSVSISALPSSQQPIFLGGTIQLTALVASSGHPDARIDWVLNSTFNPDPSLGTLQSTGPTTATYTAPSLAPPNPNPIAISAYCICDPSSQPMVELTVMPSSYSVFAGAGDIAVCGDPPHGGADFTEDMLDNISGTVFAVGDLAYPGSLGYSEGSDQVFTCYDAAWGSLKSRTRPVPGDHEYKDVAHVAQGYFDYWRNPDGSNGAGDPAKGYYGYDLGAWHVVVINSACEYVGGCHNGSPQQMWLKDDLANHPGVCTLALWHVPWFDAGGSVIVTSTEEPELHDIWQTLLNGDVHIVVNGHVHNYQRWARQDADGVATGAGIRQFVIGTGGPVDSKDGITMGGNLEVGGTKLGVLQFTLHQDTYDWQHLNYDGSPGDSMTGESCHSISTSPAAVSGQGAALKARPKK